MGREKIIFEEIKKCRVLQVTSVPFTFEKLLLPLIKALKENEFDVDLCCGEGEYLQALIERGNRVIVMPFTRSAISLSHIKAFFSLYRLFKQENYHIVHFHTPIVSAIGRLAARLAGIPVVIYTAHGFYFHDRMNPLVYIVCLIMERVLAKIATEWLFLQSKEDEITARRYNFMRDEKRIIWIGNGVDPEEFMMNKDREKLRKQNGFSENDVIFGFVGRLVKNKGILELIEAFSRVRNTHDNVKLLIIGGTLESDRHKRTGIEVRKLIEKHNIENEVKFLGFRDDIPALLSAIDIFMLPSYREGVPRSIIEAMMSGKPVIATRIRGCREVILHGETGLLVSPKNINELAMAMEYMISNEERTKEMGRKGRERARKLFDETQVLERQLTIYKMIAKELAKDREANKAVCSSF